MIVEKPIGAVKANGTIHRLTVGKMVPEIVLEFWEKTGQIESLKKSGAISDPEKVQKDNYKKFSQPEIKEEKNESIFKTENR